MNLELAHTPTHAARATFADRVQRWQNRCSWIAVSDHLVWRRSRLVSHGPALLLLSDHQVQDVISGAELPADWREILARATPDVRGFIFDGATAAPGLLEGHAHLFLAPDTAPLTDEPQLRARAKLNAEAALRCGVLWLRDCGDPLGVNLWTRDHAGASPVIQACGAAIHRRKRYGKQLGLAVADDAEFLTAVQQRIDAGADAVKVLLSGIVDFAKGDVPGEPQFSAPALRDAIKLTHDHGKRFVVHASGRAATALAAEVGVDSIEHGYFVAPETLETIAAKGIAWLPTLAPVYVQWRDAARYGHSPETRASLRRILDGHAASIARAAALGVKLVAGSDAGSPAVGHGPGASLEAQLLSQTELGREAAYAASSAPGAEAIGFKEATSALTPGGPADFLILPASPLEDLAVLAQPLAVVRQGKLLGMTLRSQCGSAQLETCECARI